MTTPYFLLGNAAKGSIQPRVHQQDRLEEFTTRLYNGEFHVPLSDVTIPARCVDGRLVAGSQNPLTPNAAGGSESLFVADDLTTKRFAGSDGTTFSGYRNVLEAIKASGNEVGGHTDSHASGVKSGCGANDRLAEIYTYIATNTDTLRDLAKDLGLQVADTTHELIRTNAASRRQFSEGAELLTALKEVARPDFVDILEGEHSEVAAVITMRAERTLDRAAVKVAFGSDYQAFNVDLWAFQKAAELLADTPAEAEQKLAAMVYYNLATTLTLAGPALRVIVVS